MPNFVADTRRLTTHLSTDNTQEIHLSLSPGMKASLKGAD